MRNALYFLGLLLLAACGTEFSNTGQPDKAVTKSSGQSMDLEKPCNIVVTPLVEAGQDKAITRYQKAILNNVMPLPNLEKLGWEFISEARHSFDSGYYKLAEQTAICIQEKQQGSAAARLIQGHALHNLHRFSEAEALARGLVSERGLWFEYGLLGDALMEQGRLEEASDAYQSMMDQRPGPQAYSRSAHLRWLKGDLEGAIDMMALAVRAIGSRDREAAAWARVRLGMYLFQAGQFTSAQHVVDQALSLQNDYPPALLAKGKLFLAQNEAATAVEVLQRAVQQNPLPEYRWYLIEAMQAAQMRSVSRPVEAQLHRSGAAQDRRTYALYLSSTRQDVDTALRLARGELESRQDVFSLDAMAWALFAANKNQQALTYSMRAMAEGTRDARLFYHAGAIARAAGDDANALRWLSMARSIEYMLLPSERQALANEFAALSPRIPSLANPDESRQARFVF